jgi:hypothetical protein
MQGGHAAIGEAHQRDPRAVHLGQAIEITQAGIGISQDHGLGDLEEPVDEPERPVAARTEGIDDQRGDAHLCELRAVGELPRAQDPGRAVQQHDGGDGRVGAGGLGHEQEGVGVGRRVKHLALADLPEGERTVARVGHELAGLAGDAAMVRPGGEIDRARMHVRRQRDE